MTLNKIYFTVIRPIFALICSIMDFFSNILNKTKSSYFVLFHLENIGRGFKQENICFSKF